jgi:hypothetical protein
MGGGYPALAMGTDDHHLVAARPRYSWRPRHSKDAVRRPLMAAIGSDAPVGETGDMYA